MMSEHWAKSSYSNREGGNCVEARCIMDGWTKSSYSNGKGGECVEARGVLAVSTIAVRDTQNRDLGSLCFPGGEWTALLDTLRQRG
ncbi:DUF397 domain-containing protein [Nocardiopsis sp. NPDC049922]|uniref:DUF397 domain-containing protein n=1 Tax=Nocardiopsis sp. NPDC049922 TaxID=3155157 RepID=UPI0033CFC7FA